MHAKYLSFTLPLKQMDLFKTGEWSARECDILYCQNVRDMRVRNNYVCPDCGLVIRPVNDEQKLLPSWAVSDPFQSVGLFVIRTSNGPEYDHTARHVAIAAAQAFS